MSKLAERVWKIYRKDGSIDGPLSPVELRDGLRDGTFDLFDYAVPLDGSLKRQILEVDEIFEPLRTESQDSIYEKSFAKNKDKDTGTKVVAPKVKKPNPVYVLFSDGKKIGRFDAQGIMQFYKKNVRSFFRAQRIKVYDHQHDKEIRLDQFLGLKPNSVQMVAIKVRDMQNQQSETTKLLILGLLFCGLAMILGYFILQKYKEKQVNLVRSQSGEQLAPSTDQTRVMEEQRIVPRQAPEKEEARQRAEKAPSQNNQPTVRRSAAPRTERRVRTVKRRAPPSVRQARRPSPRTTTTRRPTTSRQRTTSSSSQTSTRQPSSTQRPATTQAQSKSSLDFYLKNLNKVVRLRNLSFSMDELGACPDQCSLNTTDSSGVRITLSFFKSQFARTLARNNGRIPVAQGLLTQRQGKLVVYIQSVG